MFLVAAGDYRTGIDNKSSPSFMAWPFQVACESGKVVITDKLSA